MKLQELDVMEVEVQYVLMRTLFIYGMLKQVMKFNPPINIIKMLKHNVKLRRFKIVLFQQAQIIQYSFYQKFQNLSIRNSRSLRRICKLLRCRSLLKFKRNVLEGEIEFNQN